MDFAALFLTVLAWGAGIIASPFFAVLAIILGAAVAVLLLMIIGVLIIIVARAVE